MERVTRLELASAPHELRSRGPRTSGLHISAARRADRWRQRVLLRQTKIRGYLIRYPLISRGASDEARTRYLHLGKVALYQMSYTRSDKRDCSKNLAVCQGGTENFFAV